jgi:hypothetical protein
MAAPRQDWALVCCIIEIVVEMLTIIIYAIVLHRIYSKKKLRKSMDTRDKARSDLYLAQLRTQSAPNTPGFASPRTATFPSSKDELSRAEEGDAPTQFASKHNSYFAPTKSFTLQPPPSKAPPATGHASPKLDNGFEDVSMTPPPPPASHVPAGPGEQVYASVPIPGAYASPLTSPAPTAAPVMMSFGQAVTTGDRVESEGPLSPRMPRP